MTFIRAAAAQQTHRKKRRAYHACGVDVASIYNKNICSYMCVVYASRTLYLPIYRRYSTSVQCGGSHATNQVAIHSRRVGNTELYRTVVPTEEKLSPPLVFFSHTQAAIT